ncbi:hypothetical protein [Thauera sp.]|jgi:hypothetical protein|uniref:hypothetical protein n=1 Tax=Thauera sp. TaxID=1905334 RepID=UPI002A35B25B|nr:hypothetical protein [Thauera sp.]MDX9886234.1 hypothetical protein [Thauera sp.]
MPAPLAPGLVGEVLVRQPGRGRGRNACRHGPAHFGRGLARGVLFAAVVGLMPAAALAQQPQAVASAPDVPEWRRTDAYVFRAIGDVTRRMQFVAQAMQLRDYCADRSVSDDFVRERLQRFSAMTGREESCTTLLDY